MIFAISPGTDQSRPVFDTCFSTIQFGPAAAGPYVQGIPAMLTLEQNPHDDKLGELCGLCHDALNDMAAGKPVAVPETTPYGCSVKYGN